MATRPPQAGSVIGNANSTGATAIARSADLNCLSLLQTKGERKRQAEAANSYLFDLSSENSSNPAHFFAGIMQNHPANRLFGAPVARPTRSPAVPCWCFCLPMDRGWLGSRAHSWRPCRPRRWSGDRGKRGDFLSHLPRFIPLEKQARLTVSLQETHAAGASPLHPKASP